MANLFNSDGDPIDQFTVQPPSDTDALPGGNENSAAYDRIFNPQGENEFTNLPENPDQLEEAFFLRRQAQAARDLQSELRNALTRVQFWPHAGRFVIPKKNTFASHLALVREGNTIDIHFDPKTYVYFDKVIASHANRPELFDSKHPDYLQYETLRENLAVLRNDLMGIYMDDGSFDPGDQRYLPKLAQIATDIGTALHVDNAPSKVLFKSLDAESMNVLGEGAAYTYQFLLDSQTSNSILGHIWASIKRFMGQPGRQWGLPPIERTAFSPDGLTAPAARDELCSCSHSELRQRCAEMARDQSTILDKETIDIIASHERSEAIKHGHTILDWLRNIRFSNLSVEDFMNMGAPADTAEERGHINALLNAYSDVTDTAFRSNPDLKNHPKIQEAEVVMEVMEHTLELMAKLEKPRSQADTMQISSDVTQQPDRWHELAKHTVERLMDTLKGGLEEAVMAMEQQQQDMEQQQEETTDRAVDEATLLMQSGKRRRRRRASGQGFAKQKRVDLAIRADDYALGQGVHRERGEQQDARESRTMVRNTSHNRELVEQVQLAAQAARMPHSAPLGEPLPSQQAPMTAATLAADSALVKQLGKAMLGMQHQASAAASELKEQVLDASNPLSPANEQPFAQRQQEASNKPNSKRPRIG